MYCGSCVRDNALAAELIARGHDVTLVPVYTPTRTDEPNVSRRHVLFGGISVYLQQYVPFFRKTPRFLDRCGTRPGSSTPSPVVRCPTIPQLLGDLTISMLQGERGVLRKEFDKLLDWIRSEPLPDVINLPNSLLIALAAAAARSRESAGLLHAAGRGALSSMASCRRIASGRSSLIRQQVSHVDRFIAVSDYCAEFMSQYLSISAEKESPSSRSASSMDGYERRTDGSLKR